MVEITIKQSQQIVDDFVRERNWQTSASDITLHLVEEMGEIARNVLKMKNYGGQHTQNSEINMDEELADVFYLILKLANETNIDLEKALLTKMEKIRKKYPKND